MDRKILTNEDLHKAAKLQTNVHSYLTKGIIFFFVCLTLFMSISSMQQGAFESVPLLLFSGSLLVAILLYLNRRRQTALFSAIANKHYQIIFAFVAEKEIEDGGETTSLVLSLSNGQRFFPSKADYKAAVIGNAYYFVYLQNRHTFVSFCMFDAQQYQLGDELKGQFKES